MLKTDIADALLQKYGKKNPPQIRPGDTVRVHQKIREGEKERIQIFEGLVIALKHGRGLDGTFTVRKIAVGGIGVERTYPLHSPMIEKVERVKTATVSRGKLYYMRERRGKTARFKEEVSNVTSWDEQGMVTAPVEDEAEEVLEALVETAAEQEEAQVPEDVTTTPEIPEAEETTESKEEEPAA